MKKRKLKVLLFNPLTTTGGISKILSDYISNFSDNIEVEMMTLKINNYMYFEDKNIKTYEIGVSKNLFKRIKLEYKIMKEKKYDIIHVNGDYCSRIIECMVAKRVGIKKIIIHSHNANAASAKKIKNLIHSILKKMFDFCATDFFACSDFAAKWMFSKKIYSNKRYKFIKNGIDTNKFKYDFKERNKVRKGLNLDSKFVIGHIGRFQYQKNHSFLIEIFNECKKIDKNVALLLLGEGPLEDDIKKKVKTLNLENDVYFLGNQRDVYKYYSAMDCFLLPSFFEGLPIVGVEAQASGLYVYLSDTISKDAKIIDSVNFISLNNSSRQWAEIIMNQRSINRKDIYIKVCNCGYDIKRVVKDLEKLYQS